MSELPWMKVYIGTETSKTIGLTPEEFGCYERLRRYCWEHRGLPDDDRRLMRITGIDPSKWDEVRSAICPLFAEGWRLPDLEKEWAESATKRDRKIAAGKKGAAARWGDGGINGKPNGYANGDATTEFVAEPLEVPMANAMDNQWPSASASDEVRYDERLAPTRVHARDLGGDIPFDPPQTEEDGRAFLRRQGLGPKGISQAIGPLMDHRLYRDVLDQISMQWGAA